MKKDGKETTLGEENRIDNSKKRGKLARCLSKTQ